jgi:hypothetical protein
MAIFKPLSKMEIRESFTHRGWFAFCPVYLAEDGLYGVKVSERNGIPVWWMSLAEVFMSMAIFLLSAINSNYAPQWAFFVTGEIERE